MWWRYADTKMSNKSYFLLWIGCGSSFNTRPELLALWRLLLFAYTRGILALHVFGDSKLVMGLEKGETSLQVSILDKCCARIN